jgi:hypothetical protein
MESAAESGKIAAKMIYEDDKEKKSDIYIHIKKQYTLFYLFRLIDSYIYKNETKIIIIVIMLILLFSLSRMK